MSKRGLLAEVEPFVGQQVIDCEDAIETAAASHGYSVMILDPVFNPGSIDSDPKRLNVHTDENSVITEFTTG